MECKIVGNLRFTSTSEINFRKPCKISDFSKKVVIIAWRQWKLCFIGQNYYIMEFNSIIRGHHIYKEIWNHFVGEELQCKIEHGNVHNIYAVAVIREDIVVGHLPRNISTPCIFCAKVGLYHVLLMELDNIQLTSSREA